MTLKVSVSSLDTYESCPRKYKFQQIDKLPRKTWEHLDVGNYVHEVLEHFHKQLNADASQQPEELLKQLAKNTWNKFSTKISAEGMEKSKGLLKSYLAYVSSEGWPDVLATEDRFSIEINKDLVIRGVVDRIDRTPTGYRILDYKTGKSKNLDKFQLQVYGMHLKNLFPDIQEYDGVYLVLPEGPKEVSYTFTLGDIEEAKEDVIKTAESIATDKTWEPKPTFLCNYCDYYDACPDAWGKGKSGGSDLVKISGRKKF